MTRIRVLVVDDSVVIRKALSEALARDPAIEVIAAASNGQIALAKLAQSLPDLVTLDVEMPVMDGLEALVKIRALYPKLPVIMFSTLTERGAQATLEALTLGASDYATKPSNTGSMESARAAIENELIPKIKALVRSRRSAPPTLPILPSPPAPVTARPHNARIEIVAIGSSTGGPNALAEVMQGIPADFPVPIVIVQHMPPLFTRLLADRLSSRSAIPVEEGRPGAPLEAGHAWIAPGNFHMTVAGLSGHLKLNQDSPENSCRPAVDVLFRSVAATYHASVLGVIMTGMGGDGTIGARSIRQAGGTVIIQDEATSVVWGMPGSVYAQGLADGVYPLDRLAPEIVRRVTETRSRIGADFSKPLPAARTRKTEEQRG